MDLIADVLLLAGAFTAALYCWVLSKRVKGLNDLDTGLGSAVASLSSQVNGMQTALKATQAVTGSSIAEMEELAERAEKAAERLNLMLATVQEEKEEPSRKSSRVRKFPSPSKADDSSNLDLKQTKSTGDVEKEEEPTRAEKLQKEVVERITGRDDQGSRDELVQALQSILAASK